MKHVEFSASPERFEILPIDEQMVRVLFYEDVEQSDPISGSGMDGDDESSTERYGATCYELITMNTANLAERINKNYEKWLAAAKAADGGIEKEKAARIADSKAMLADYLAGHPIHSNAHGDEGVYSVTQEKQTLMMSQYITYQAEKATNPSAKLTWNESGKSCTEWTEEQFMKLILEIKAYVYPLVSYQQAVEEQIDGCKTPEELEAIVIDYGSAKHDEHHS